MSGTLGDIRPEIEAMERATGNKVRVWEAPDGKLCLDFSTPGGKRPNAPAASLGSRRDRRRTRRNKQS